MAIDQYNEPLMATLNLSQTLFFFPRAESSKGFEHDQCHRSNPVEAKLFQLGLPHPEQEALWPRKETLKAKNPLPPQKHYANKEKKY